MESSTYKLVYYDVRWEGEQIRLMFAYKEVEFEDIRIKLQLGAEDWPVPSQLFDQIPKDIQDKLLLEKLPLLELSNGKTISGARACSLFVAKRFGLLGSDEFEEAKINEILDASQDFSEAFYAIQLASTKEEKEKVSQNVVAVVTPKYMNLFNKLVEENSSGFMVGNQLSLADLHVFNIVCTPDGKPARHVTDGRPGLEKLVDKVSQIPQIQKWLEARPKSIF
ncbi:glutathione S-transferase 1-like [Bradysia coprophila]|uniref:glutathione S-transferase 1-like n=1 Tax=Bradysia coprophila TaxID=38358 RepID=UPI00187DBD7A|nr:glutathione S-transferase 1-like [Bradysia coprophila]